MIDGFFLLSIFLLISNALDEAIAAKLDLKCCLEAGGALRDDENVERGTEEESLRAKVENSINRAAKIKRQRKKKKK